MDKIAAELQDSVVDLTRQLTELQARYESTRNQQRSRMQGLDQRELQLQARELRVKSEEEAIRERWKCLEMRERNAETHELKELERLEHLGQLEKSVEERERSLDELHESLEEQRKHSRALQEVLEEHLGSVGGGLRVKLRQFEEKAREIGLELSDGGGGLKLKRGELVGCEMGGGLDAEKVVKLIGVICQRGEIMELCQGLDSGDKIHDVIRILIERKQLIEAVRFICTFKLTDKFPPVPLLNESVEDAEKWWSETFSQKKSLDKKGKAVDDRITNLRAVVQCVEEYNLQSEYSLADIINDILELEKLKENLHSVASLDIMMKTKGLGKLKERREVVLCLPSFDDKQGKEFWRKRRFRTYRRCRKKCNP
ncbi:FRIGIDA-like protein 2 [Rosa rugosa]|uniref:FRIGIDA-like protein 2 n=1 Tax=Rosa rugosa TaxID=74645 RepID=UPI002B408098|nr:FRIGIDA-like protein 2 [Rosa rugosa]